MARLAISLTLLAAVTAGCFLVRRRLGVFWSAAGTLAAAVLFVAFGFDPPAPASLVRLYAAVGAVAMGLYVTSSDEALRSFREPIRALLVERRLRPALALVLVGLPALTAWRTALVVRPASDAPPRIRSVHPSPPGTFTLNAPNGSRSMDVLSERSKVRLLDPRGLADAIARGKVVYYQNCVFCHGDTLSADGQYAGALSPPPADFSDPGTIAMLQESYLFWRVATGGPGLPAEGTPWDSAMPAWQQFLTEEEIWAVIAFLYDYTGYTPRAPTAHSGEEAP